MLVSRSVSIMWLEATYYRSQSVYEAKAKTSIASFCNFQPPTHARMPRSHVQCPGLSLIAKWTKYTRRLHIKDEQIEKLNENSGEI